MDTAARPSASANSIAALVIRCSVRPSLGCGADLAHRDHRSAGPTVPAHPARVPTQLHAPLCALRRMSEENLESHLRLVECMSYALCMTYTMEVSGLTKRFGDTTVLSGIDLRVRAGEIFALLGPNGAGKTTTVSILSTLLRADAGHGDRGRVRPRHPAAAGPVGDQPDRPVRGGRRGADRSGEPGDDGQAPAPAQESRSAPRRRTARPVRSGRRRRSPGPDLLGRHAAAARPGDEPGRRSGRAVPRRTHQRPGSPQPARGVGRRRRHSPARASPCC